MTKRKLICLCAAVFCLAILGRYAITSMQKSRTDLSAPSFKSEYEGLNGTVNASGKENRTITIPEENPFVMATAEEIVQKAEAKETFYVVYSDPLCPWCRSVMETACKTAKQNQISTIYAVDIWDDDGKEILRDQYKLDQGTLTKVSDGTEAYQKTLDLFGSVLSDYTLSDDNGTKYSVGEKRIYAPNFLYIKNGEAVGMTEGISELQKDAREPLSDAVLKDEEKIFNHFFQEK